MRPAFMKTLRYILHNERGILSRLDLVYNNSQKEAGGKQMRKSRLLRDGIVVSDRLRAGGTP